MEKEERDVSGLRGSAVIMTGCEYAIGVLGLKNCIACVYVRLVGCTVTVDGSVVLLSQVAVSSTFSLSAPIKLLIMFVRTLTRHLVL